MSQAVAAVDLSDIAEDLPSRQAFLQIAFSALETHAVRYCVLHGWERLVGTFDGDVDLAVHPDDRPALARAFGTLVDSGFRLIQCLNYAPGGYYFVFAWRNHDAVESLAIDIAFEHRRHGLTFDSAATLVADRQRGPLCWVASSATRFRYLLIKKVLKGHVPPHQERALQTCAETLGETSSCQISAELFGPGWGDRVATACREGRLSTLIPALRRRMFWMAVRRAPWNPVHSGVAEAARKLRRWCQPTGVLVALLGPDGAGKSLVASQLTNAPTAAFRRVQQFHWRPAVLRRRTSEGPVTDPHGRPAHSTMRSVAWLGFQLLDYWCGYAMVIRPQLARSSLLIFDRYLDDLLVDQRRFRCQLPTWLVRRVRKWVKRPDIVFVLDAPTHVVRARKQEVSPEESERQRTQYQLLGTLPRARVIDASQRPAIVYSTVLGSIIDVLAVRTERRHAEWLVR